MSIFVTVNGPRRSIDLELSEAAPIGDLIPLLLEIQGVATGNKVLDSPNIWGLGPWDGQPFPPNRSLSAVQIADGAVLVLRDLASWQRQPHQANSTQVPPTANTGGIGIKWNTDGLLG